MATLIIRIGHDKQHQFHANCNGKQSKSTKIWYMLYIFRISLCCEEMEYRKFRGYTGNSTRRLLSKGREIMLWIWSFEVKIMRNKISGCIPEVSSSRLMDWKWGVQKKNPGSEPERLGGWWYNIADGVLPSPSLLHSGKVLSPPASGNLACGSLITKSCPRNCSLLKAAALLTI